MGSFGSVIKEIRKKRKLTQMMLSEDICSQSVLSRIENDEELPNVVVMQQLCQRLGVTMDQIMQFHSAEVDAVTKTFDTIHAYFLHKEYQKISALMEETHLEEKLHLDTDLQRYYYYVGSCAYYVHHNFEKTVFNFKKALSFTYHSDKHHLSDLEIQIISCLGRTYAQMGKMKEAKQYLELSIQYFHELPNQRMPAELSKIFFHYAEFLLQQKEYGQADHMTNQGILWSKKQNSYYYLAELFQLKGRILDCLGEKEKSQAFHQLSQQITQIETLLL